MIRKFILVLFVILLFALPCYATDVEYDIEKEIYFNIENNLNEFKNSIPKEILELLPEDIWNGNFDSLLGKDFSEANILELSIDFLFAGINKGIVNFASILIIIIVSSIFNTLSVSFSSNFVKTAFSYASTLCIALAVFNLCNEISVSVSNYLYALCGVMEGFSPLMCTLYIMTGNLTGGGISSASFVLFIAVIERFLITFMLPISNICICFSIMKAFGNQYDFSGISKVLKNTFTGITVFIMSIFMFVLSSKSVLTQAADSLSIKTARFAISSFIPIVSSTVNDALRTISASLSAIKSSCGIIAIVIIALIMLPVIISLLINRLFFNITASISKALGCNSECSVLEEAGSICGFLLALVLCTCILFIFALNIFIKATVVI